MAGITCFNGFLEILGKFYEYLREGILFLKSINPQPVMAELGGEVHTVNSKGDKLAQCQTMHLLLLLNLHSGNVISYSNSFVKKQKGLRFNKRRDLLVV